MTKYVLNSGGIKHQPVLKKKFHQELVKGLGNSPKFLLCNFAQGREYWESIGSIQASRCWNESAPSNYYR